MANPLTAPKHFIIIIKGSEWAPGIGKFLPQRFNSIFLEAPDEKGPTSATKVFLVLNPRGEIGSPVAARGVSHSLQAAAHGSRSAWATEQMSPEHSVGGAVVGGSKASRRAFCLFEIERTFWALGSASENTWYMISDNFHTLSMS